MERALFPVFVCLDGESPSQSSSRTIPPPDILRSIDQRCKVLAIEEEDPVISCQDRDQRSRWCKRRVVVNGRKQEIKMVKPACGTKD